jgi:hypothetical protein
MIKLSVGTEDVESLREWQAYRLRETGQIYHQTRMMPRRQTELLDGGSIYWVIKGQVRVRQRLLDIETYHDGEGQRFARLILDQELHRTINRPHRPFQGWRYLKPADAPVDLSDAPDGVAEMPEEMRAKLREMGLI